MKTLHVGLRAADRDRSLAFYTAVGYEIVGEVPETELGHLTMLKLPGDEFVTIEVVHDPNGPLVGTETRLSHLVVQVDSMDATVAELTGRGIDVETPTSPDGSEDFRTTWIVDPDGNRIELVQWPAGHADGMTAADFVEDGIGDRSARGVVEELLRRQEAGDAGAVDDLVAADMVNHAAGAQGRDGLKRILQTIEHDLGPISYEQHHLVADGELVVQHVAVRGTHRASTMPLLEGIPASGRAASWTFIHIWRVVDGLIVEHWACRDDMGLVEQLRG